MKQLALALGDAPRRARTAALRSAHFQSHVEPEEAIARDVVAGRQEGDVLAAFQAAAEDARGDRYDDPDPDAARLTPSQVQALLKYLHGRHPLLTSVRRAITNLTKRGLLVHHPEDRRPGQFGAKESTWSLA